MTVATHDDKVDLWDGVADLSNACSINKRPLFPQESSRKRSFPVQSTRFTSFPEDMLIFKGKDRDRSSRCHAASSRRHFVFRRKHRRAKNYPNKFFFENLKKNFVESAEIFWLGRVIGNKHFFFFCLNSRNKISKWIDIQIWIFCHDIGSMQ